MSILNKIPISATDFVQNVFSVNPKPIFFWDTCALLDIIRLVYRNGDINTLKSIIEIKKLIDTNQIYSVCSQLTIIEWNEHFAKIMAETHESLNLTSDFHKNSVDMINHIFSSNYCSDHIGDKGLIAELEKIADGICQASTYLTTDEIAQNALIRVSNKQPPSAKKPEFKDCAIWETVLDVADKVKSYGLKFVYLTVNTEDYLDKARTPHRVHGSLIAEAITYNIHLEMKFIEAYNKIK